MGQITADQSWQVIAALMTNVDWKSIDFDTLGLQDAIIRNAQEAGKQFELFLKNRARIVIGEIKYIRTKPFNPAEFIGKDWRIWRGPIGGDGLTGEKDTDPRSQDIAEIEIARILFETCLREGENSIKGEEKLSRLKKAGHIRLGGNTFLGLWEDYQANKENSILELLYRTRKITYLDFFGDILRAPDGRRSVLCLYRNDDGQWDWLYNWLGHDWNADHLSAGYAS